MNMKYRKKLIHEYLESISNGYETGDFTTLFPFLAEECVLESQWVLKPNVGYDAVTSYLTGKGNTLKNSGCFPSCRVIELVGNINTIDNINFKLNGEEKHGNIGLYYPDGELCLLMEQTLNGVTNGVVLRIQLNNEEKISRLDLCMPELFRFRDYTPLSPQY